MIFPAAYTHLTRGSTFTGCAMTTLHKRIRSSTPNKLQHPPTGPCTRISLSSTTRTNLEMTSVKDSALKHARALEMPTREEVLRRDSKVYRFWNSNEGLLERAWLEWNKTKEAVGLPKLGPELLCPRLRAAVEAARADPTEENEAAVKELWKEVAPGVFTIQMFNTGKVEAVRAWFDATADAGIPTRSPYGIVLNRKGVMTDPRSVGYLAAPDFQTFYKMLVDDYVRPLGRLFFPDHIRETDDDESFSFSIQYQGVPGGDKAIRHHSDASTVTFNINLDSSKTWTGSSLVFFTAHGNHKVEWAPGIAVIHLGRTMHAALPIESGTRANWVIWTMGSGGHRAYGAPPFATEDGTYPSSYQLTPQERWAKPKRPDGKPEWSDRWSPF